MCCKIDRHKSILSVHIDFEKDGCFYICQFRDTFCPLCAPLHQGTHRHAPGGAPEPARRVEVQRGVRLPGDRVVVVLVPLLVAEVEGGRRGRRVVVVVVVPCNILIEVRSVTLVSYKVVVGLHRIWQF